MQHRAVRRRLGLVAWLSLPAWVAMLAVCGSVAAAKAPPPAGRRIAAMIDTFRAGSGADVGVSVVDLRSGRTIAAFEPDKLLIPASNQKLLTSAFALSRLGGDFEFVTRAYLSNGDLLIVGGDFDPTTGDSRLAKEAGKSIYAEFDRIASAVRANAPGRSIGNIILTPSSPGRPLRHDDWPKDQHNRWYCAPVSRRNFNSNCFDVTFKVSAGQAVATVIPQSRFIKVVNRVKVAKKHLWSLSVKPDASQVTLTGSIKGPAPSPYSVAVNNPSAVYGRILAGRIIKAGAAITGQIRREDATRPPGLKPICTIKTPLAVAMKRANKRSLNMAAECLMLRAGDGTWQGSARIMADTLAGAYGLKGWEFVIRDGGGLSRGNRVTPAAMTRLLAKLAKRHDASMLLASLPIAGVDGTLRKRLRGERYRGRVIAKTGRIRGVSCLSGYVLDGDGRPAVAFSILINRLPGRAKQNAKALQDNICRVLVDSL